MATYLWFVPGFMGSTLSLYRQGAGGARSGPPIAQLWGGIPSLVNVNVVNLLFLPPALPAGTMIAADGLAPSTLGGYTDFAAAMSAALPANWAWVSWPFDWRLSCRDNGRLLATALETAASQGNTNYVLSHSQGSLVTWAAWAYLVSDAQTSAMARWVSMGGLLYGSGTAPGTFLEKEESLNLLLFLQQLRAAGPLGPPLAVFASNNEQAIANLIGVAASWPGLYDMYPDPSSLDDSGDANRGLLWDATKWQAALVTPNAALLLQEKTYFHQWLRTTANLPPPAVASHIVGVGHSTPIRVQPAATTNSPGLLQAINQGFPTNALARRLLQLPMFTSDNTGDGRATQQQQQFPGYYTQHVGSLHGSMQNDPYVRELALQMFQQANPTAPVKPALQAPTEWIPAPAVPVPPIQLIEGIVDPAGPVQTTPTRPLLPPRVGVDP